MNLIDIYKAIASLQHQKQWSFRKPKDIIAIDKKIKELEAKIKNPKLKPNHGNRYYKNR